jgi:hypothetical protein
MSRTHRAGRVVCMTPTAPPHPAHAAPRSALSAPSSDAQTYCQQSVMVAASLAAPRWGRPYMSSRVRRTL